MDITIIPYQAITGNNNTEGFGYWYESIIPYQAITGNNNNAPKWSLSRGLYHTKR